MNLEEIIRTARLANTVPGEEELRALPFRKAFIYGRVSSQGQVRESRESIMELAKLVEIARKDGYRTSLVTSEVEKWLNQAESSFKAGEYTEAFKYACKAKKALDTAPVLPETVDKTGITGADLPDMGEPEHRDTEVGVPRLCSECGAELSEDDLFCGRCGAPVRKVTRCPSCGAEAQEGDRFCRKCGSPLN